MRGASRRGSECKGNGKQPQGVAMRQVRERERGGGGMGRGNGKEREREKLRT